MAAANRTVISFGLVAIPIAMHTAVQDNDISFNQLHKDDYQRVRYKKVLGHCGEEVRAEDIVKGYQYDKHHYVIVTDDDIEKIKTPKEKSIQIMHFAQLNQISPIFYDKAYHVTPEAGGDKAFELLRRALVDAQKIAIGKTVMGSHGTLKCFLGDSMDEIKQGTSETEIKENSYEPLVGQISIEELLAELRLG